MVADRCHPALARTFGYDSPAQMLAGDQRRARELGFTLIRSTRARLFAVLEGRGQFRK